MLVVERNMMYRFVMFFAIVFATQGVLSQNAKKVAEIRVLSREEEKKDEAPGGQAALKSTKKSSKDESSTSKTPPAPADQQVPTANEEKMETEEKVRCHCLQQAYCLMLLA